MTSVRKSPNMMSTTGRRPVIAAPTPSPVIPASEIGESSTRSGPNSSTRPASTLNGVPASATSSPRMNTAGSRASSSLRAALIACANVSSSTTWADGALDIDVLRDLARVGEGRVERESEAALDLRPRLLFDPPQLLEPRAEQRKRVALVAPELLLLLRAVVGAVDVADVVAVVAVSVREQERRPRAGTGAL